ncbi:Rcs stress response system protein RcsF [Pantoea sp. 1.19]|uniref:Rcs stress response system protein RcsF n=1 Tax=Pantoea sp. 1.19 TaxID=1925589 RepID=UPI000948F7B4|nr:Rcs stress response system protein RcsF [Pantoea sp. 1.19]
MRVLSLCALALLLSGCSAFHDTPSSDAGRVARPQPKPTAPQKTAPRPAPVKIYTDAAELVSKPFRDLGEVAGEDCQTNTQDSPPNLATARKRLQIRASGMKANAVLLHKCEIITSAPGCYRQAVCQGSALKVSGQ